MTATSATVASGIDGAQLYERYGEQIYRYCLRRLRNREEAADAAQNTFLRMHVALEKGVVPRYEAAWLYKIAHNACLAWIESAGRRALVESPRGLDSLDEAALAAPASDHEAIEELAEALAALPLNLRRAILLREWQGLTYAEIAAAMDTTVSAVETLLVRARRRLRRGALGAVDALGLRGLLSGAAGKVAAGAALVAVGGSGIGASVALSGRPSSPPVRPAPTAFAPPTAAAHPRPATLTLPAPPARLPRRRASTPPATTHRVSTPRATHPRVARPPAPVAPASDPAPPVPAATAPTPTGVAPTLPQAPIVSTPALPAVVVTVTTPQLPVTTPALAVPAVTLP